MGTKWAQKYVMMGTWQMEMGDQAHASLKQITNAEMDQMQPQAFAQNEVMAKNTALRSEMMET